MSTTATRLPSGPAVVQPDRTIGGWFDRYRVSAISGRGSIFAPRTVLLVLVTLAVLGYGLVTASSIRYSLIIGLVMAIAVLGNNAITGLLGEINLGMGAFVALGAYLFAYLLNQGWSVLAAFPVTLAASLVVGVVLAVPTTRLAGIFTALVTFALASAVPSLVMELGQWTGGQRGTGVPSGTSLFGIEITGSSRGLLVLVSVLFLAVGLGCLALLRSRVGRVLLTVGEARQAAECFGIATRRWEIAIWSTASAMAGLAGCLYTLAVGYLTPEVFPVFLSISLLVAAFVGGARAPLGALLGGLLIGALPPNIQSIVPAESTGMLFGLAMYLTLFAGGLGLAGWVEKSPIAVRRLIGGRR
jgi:branched-chain amino acid transport system permease protein